LTHSVDSLVDKLTSRIPSIVIIKGKTSGPGINYFNMPVFAYYFLELLDGTNWKFINYECLIIRCYKVISVQSELYISLLEYLARIYKYHYFPLQKTH